MKLRIKGDSLRLLVSRSELARFLSESRIEETIHFCPSLEAKLIYALECDPGALTTTVRYRIQEIAVALTDDAAHDWAKSYMYLLFLRLSGPHHRAVRITEHTF
jgi:hypothetical protein